MNDAKPREQAVTVKVAVLIGHATNFAAASRHLRAFHMAVPAVVAAAVEAGLVAKEALGRRRRGPAVAGFTNDGLPLGLVFLLKARSHHQTHAVPQWNQPVEFGFRSQ